LPPRVALTSLTDVATIANPAAGLFVYNTVFTGTTPNQVYPVLYYFNGNKWQRVVNQVAQASVEFNQVTPTTTGVTFLPDIQNDKAYVYVSTVDHSQWIYNGTEYVSYTPTKPDSMVSPKL
jgi:hypothetical protein